MSDLAIPVTADDHSRGPADAPVTLVEYGDYECPHCATAQDVVHALLQQRPTEVRLVFRHFPLTQIHPHAAHAAEAAEAAGAQDAFWAMHDAMFQQQAALDDDALIVLAEQLGLDAPRVAQALADETYLEAVRANFMGGVRSGVNGTPTFFINGRRHDGGLSLEALSMAIDVAGS